MIPKTKQKFPDFLPYIRMGGPLGRSYPLSTGTTQCAVDIPQAIARQLKSKLLLDLRVLIMIDVPVTEKNKPVPESISVKCCGNTAELTNPRWSKVEGYWVHEEPVDVGSLLAPKLVNKTIKTTFDLTIDILNNANANGVAELFLSQHVTTPTLIKSVLAADPLPRDMVDERRLNMKDSGIESEIVSLKCPCLGIRIKTPVRFETCRHLECFDLQNFLKMEEKRPKGRCPVCNKLIEFRQMGVCQFTLEILKSDQNCESFRITPESVEPLSAASASESRKRKRAVLGVNSSTDSSNSEESRDSSESKPAVSAQRRRLAKPQRHPQYIALSTETQQKQQSLTENPDYIIID